MTIELKYSVAGGGIEGRTGGGFVAEHDGYSCFIYPQIGDTWVWSIHSGGGWSHRGGDFTQTHVEGTARSTEHATRQICMWLEQHT